MKFVPSTIKWLSWSDDFINKLSLKRLRVVSKCLKQTVTFINLYIDRCDCGDPACSRIERTEMPDPTPYQELQSRIDKRIKACT